MRKLAIVLAAALAVALSVAAYAVVVAEDDPAAGAPSREVVRGAGKEGLDVPETCQVLRCDSEGGSAERAGRPRSGPADRRRVPGDGALGGGHHREVGGGDHVAGDQDGGVRDEGAGDTRDGQGAEDASNDDLVERTGDDGLDTGPDPDSLEAGEPSTA